MLLINLAAFLEKSKANGSGSRAVVWVQGCPIHCTECFNSQMWSFEPQELVSVRNMAERILHNRRNITGVTFTGGEPFCQAKALGELGEILQTNGLNIITFTGYTLQELQMIGYHDWKKLLAVTDILVAGPFIAKLACNDNLRGSSNQQIIFLSDQVGIDDDIGVEAANSVEFIIEPDGTLITTGFPSHGLGNKQHFFPKSDSIFTGEDRYVSL